MISLQNDAPFCRHTAFAAADGIVCPVGAGHDTALCQLLRGRRKVTPRELEVLQLTSSGYSNTQIASALDISINTVDSYKERIKGKFGLDRRGGHLIEVDIVCRIVCEDYLVETGAVFERPVALEADVHDGMAGEFGHDGTQHCFPVG